MHENNAKPYDVVDMIECIADANSDLNNLKKIMAKQLFAVMQELMDGQLVLLPIND